MTRKIAGTLILGALGALMIVGMISDIGWFGAAIVFGLVGLFALGLWLIVGGSGGEA